MQRELNPQLFGGSIANQIFIDPVKQQQAATSSQPPAAQNLQSATRTLPKTSQKKMSRPPVSAASVPQKPQSQLITVLKGLEGRLEGLNSKTDQYLRVSQLKIDRLTSRLSQLAAQQVQTNKDLNIKYASLVGKVRERDVADDKIQGLIDRQNQVVQTFQTRMDQLQKVLNEKERQHLSLASALEEARQEIARLKRL